MSIRIQGAREHNLQNINVEFGEGLTVVTGVSGSGKTSLVFDTLYHEARRRFLDIFALGSHQRLSPAVVDDLTGLGPAVAVGQNLLLRNGYALNARPHSPFSPKRKWSSASRRFRSTDQSLFMPRWFMQLMGAMRLCCASLVRLSAPKLCGSMVLLSVWTKRGNPLP
jgi:hypothetical protein